jgi:hypothetical protein
MKLLAIGLAVTFGIAAVVFAATFVLLLLAIPEIAEAAGFAAIVAGFSILALPSIAEFAERRVGRRNWAAGKQAAVQDYNAYQLPWPVAVAYGVFVLSAADTTSTFLANVAATLDGSELYTEEFFKRVFLFALAINLPMMMLAAYFVCRWIGARCSRRGAIAVLVTFLIATVFAFGSTALTPTEMSHPAFVTLNLIQSPFILLCCLAGYWRGRKARWSKYLDYLVRVIPPGTRDTVVGLAFAEVQKAAAAARPETGSLSA